MTTLEGLFKEAAEDLERERYAHLWKRWRGVVIVAVVGVLCIATATSLWNAWRVRAQTERTEALIKILDRMESAPPVGTEGKADSADSFSALTSFAQNNTKSGTADLARLHAAQRAMRKGDVHAAVALYTEIAADEHADSLIRDLAALWAVAAHLDTGEPEKLEKALEPLLRPEFPFRARARELSVLLALKKGDEVRAMKEADALAQEGENVAPSLQRRAQVISRFLKSKPEKDAVLAQTESGS